MKKFFTKYLAVEGEYEKEGDLFIFRIGETWSKPAYADELLGDQIEEVKKVKLFLCSRDIQVGDTVKIDVLLNGVFNDFIFDLLIKNEDGEGTDCWIFSGSGSYAYYPQLEEDEPAPFKVIGEVSPEAIWVKEGEEFDEGEFKFFWEQNDYDGYSKVAEDSDFYIFEKDLHYTDKRRIKEGWKRTPAQFICPTCKTFH